LGRFRSVLRCRTSAATTTSRPGWSAATAGDVGPSWTPAHDSASRAAAKSSSWTTFRTVSWGSFRTERKRTLAGYAARCSAKFPAQCAALDADDPGTAQPHASAGEYAPAGYYARS